jgi:hypothetical protein
MSKILIRVLAASTIGLLALGAGSCGGGGAAVPANAVAVVDGTPITKATLDHWTAIEFVTDQESLAQKSPPSGLIPRPPYYAACIVRERSAEGKIPASKPRPSKARAKALCEAKYRTVRAHVLNVLIVFEWYIKEGEQKGVSPSDAQVRSYYARYASEHYPKGGGLQRFLEHAGSTYNDELLRMKMDLLTVNLSKQEMKKLGGVATPKQEHAYLKWGSEFVKDWVARTSCRPGYVVPNCKQYKGPLAPDPRI